MKYKFTIDGQDHFFSSDQDVMYGQEGVILDNDIDLMHAYSDGYTIFKLNKSKSEQLVMALQEFLKSEIFDKTGIKVENLENYHNAVNDEIHQEFIADFSKGFEKSAINSW